MDAPSPTDDNGDGSSVKIIDHTTGAVYAVPEEAFRQLPQDPLLLPMETLDYMVTKDCFSLNGLLNVHHRHVPLQTTTRQIGMLNAGGDNFLVARVQLIVPSAHPMAHELAVDGATLGMFHLIGQDLLWLWPHRFSCQLTHQRADEAGHCACPHCAMTHQSTLDAFPIGRAGAVLPDGVFGLCPAAIPGAKLVPHAALPLANRLFLQLVVDPLHGGAPTGSRNWRTGRHMEHDARAVVVADRLSAWCTIHGASTAEATRQLLERNQIDRRRGARLDTHPQDTAAASQRVQQFQQQQWSHHAARGCGGQLNPYVRLVAPQLTGTRQLGYIGLSRREWDEQVVPALTSRARTREHHEQAVNEMFGRLAVDPREAMGQDLWRRIFAMAACDNMHSDAPMAAERDLGTLMVLCKLSRATAQGVVQTGLVRALRLCEANARADDVAARPDVAADSVSAVRAGVALRNLGLPVLAGFCALPRYSKSRQPYSERDKAKTPSKLDTLSQNAAQATRYYRAWRKEVAMAADPKNVVRDQPPTAPGFRPHEAIRLAYGLDGADGADGEAGEWYLHSYDTKYAYRPRWRPMDPATLHENGAGCGASHAQLEPAHRPRGRWTERSICALNRTKWARPGHNPSGDAVSFGKRTWEQMRHQLLEPYGGGA